MYRQVAGSRIGHAANGDANRADPTAGQGRAALVKTRSLDTLRSGPCARCCNAQASRISKLHVAGSIRVSRSTFRGFVRCILPIGFASAIPATPYGAARDAVG